MCGRMTVTNPQQIVEQFGLPFPSAPRFNVAPTQAVPVITNKQPAQISLFRWGLIPSWADNPRTGQKTEPDKPPRTGASKHPLGSGMINARCESLSERAAYREAAQERRCLVLADGFYEWKKEGSMKIPHYIRKENHQAFSFAALWDSWAAPDGERIYSCTVITGPPNRLLEPIHSRMPVVIEPADRARWLLPDPIDIEAMRDLLQPPDDAGWVAYPVSPLVNSVKNDRPDCIAPARCRAAFSIDGARLPRRQSRALTIPDSVVTLLRQHFEAAVPHNRALGMKLVEVVDAGMIAELPYQQNLLGNPEAGFLHGGAITSLIDATCGMAVAIKMMRPVRIATLDLRIDYLKPAPPGQSVFCRATCYKVTSQVAFVRAVADCGETNQVASAAGTFVIFQDSPKGDSK